LGKSLNWVSGKRFKSMRLILVRHGKTEENINDILQGHLQGTLSQEGKLRNKELSEELKNQNADYIYSSDLRRAKETAEEILSKHPKTIFKTDKRLRERDLGIHTGKKRSDCFPESLMRSDWGAPGGETWDEVLMRVKEFITDIKKEHSEDTIIVVSHNGALLVMLSHLLDEDYREKLNTGGHKNSEAIFLEVEEESANLIEI